MMNLKFEMKLNDDYAKKYSQKTFKNLPNIVISTTTKNELSVWFF